MAAYEGPQLIRGVLYKEREVDVRKPVLALGVLCLISAIASPPNTGRNLEASPSKGAQPSANWRAQTLGQIWQSEYHFSPATGAALSAPNRAHGFRTTFVGDRLQMTQRVEGTDAWRLELRVTGFGREDCASDPGAPKPRALGNRLELVRDQLTEWYINGPGGLEQGFSIAERPAGPAGRLVIQMGLAGSLKPLLGPDGQEILFKTAAGEPLLRY